MEVVRLLGLQAYSPLLLELALLRRQVCELALPFVFGPALLCFQACRLAVQLTDVLLDLPAHKVPKRPPWAAESPSASPTAGLVGRGFDVVLERLRQVNCNLVELTLTLVALGPGQLGLHVSFSTSTAPPLGTLGVNISTSSLFESGRLANVPPWRVPISWCVYAGLRVRGAATTGPGQFSPSRRTATLRERAVRHGQPLPPGLLTQPSFTR